MTTPVPVTPFSVNFHSTFPFSNTCVVMQLEASTALSWTVPGVQDQYFRAWFSISTSADAYVCKGSTAVVPTSNTVSSVPYQHRIDQGMCLYVRGGDVLSFISTTTPQIGVSLMLAQK